MNLLKSIYCRAFQAAFRAALPILPYREPEIINSCSNLGTVLENEKISSVLIVTDSGIVSNGLVKPVEEALKNSSIHYTIYDKTQPNPTAHNVEDALKLYYQGKCKALIAVGGGSAIDCAKADWCFPRFPI